MQPQKNYPLNEKLTLEEYLDFEEKALEKHEYHDGYLFQRDESSNAHGTISMNISCEMYLFCLGKQSQVYNSEMKIKLKNKNSYVYADCFMIVEPKKIAKEYKEAIINPAIIVEVLSESTKVYDRGDKFNLYRAVSSLRHYVLIEQNKVQIDVYSRKSPTSLWDIRTIEGVDKSLELIISPIETLIIPLKNIYDKVVFEK